jgi:predicted transcriptional regulator of viral defense system
MSHSTGKILRRAATGLSAQEREIIDIFVADEKPTVAVSDVLALRSITHAHAAQVLARLARKGWLTRVGRGVYSVVPLGTGGSDTSSADAWVLAMALFSPCYISGWTAAEHWDLTEQIFNSTAVVTTRSQRHRERVVAGIRFVFRTADKSTFFGITSVWHGSQRVDVADPHRLVIDLLAAPDFGGGARHTLDVVRNYFRSKQADPNKLIEYAERFGKGVVFKRLGFCAETFASPDADWLRRCQRGMSQGISQLDPNGPKHGRVITRWRLRINVPVDDT